MEDGGRGWSDGSAPREHLGLLAVSAEARKEAGNKKKKRGREHILPQSLQKEPTL